MGMFGSLVTPWVHDKTAMPGARVSLYVLPNTNMGNFEVCLNGSAPQSLA